MENPLQQFQKQAGQITSAYDDAIKMGRGSSSHSMPSLH
jgi:hypothetical protein